MASKFSKDGKYFALLSNNGKLKLWDTDTNKLEQEFTPDFHLTSPFTCIHFIQPTEKEKGDKNNQPATKKVKHSKDYGTPLLAIGSHTGFLFIYNITTADTISKIGGIEQSITCLSWEDGPLVYAGIQQDLVVFDLVKKETSSKWKTGVEKISNILKIPRQNQLITASRNIKLWDIGTQKLLKTFIGHSNEVTLLECINPLNGKSYILSGAKNDRIISCWTLDGKENNSRASFQLDDAPVSISLPSHADGAPKFTVVTKIGGCNLFQHAFNGKVSKPIKPSSTIQVVADSDQNKIVTPIPIISSHINDDFTIRIAYGSPLLVFEHVTLREDEKVRCLVRKSQQPSGKKQSSISTPKAPGMSKNDVLYVTPHTADVRKRKVDGAKEMPMQTRLENLTINDAVSTTTPTGGNMVHLLMQALHSNNKIMLKEVLDHERNENTIKNTLKRLPFDAIPVLLKELVRNVNKKTQYMNPNHLWLKHLLQIHAAFLISNPEATELFTQILGCIESRLTFRNPLNRLKGRLELVISQIENSKNPEPYLTPSNQAALLVFNDKTGSDSDSDVVELDAGSEAESDWMEDEEDEIVSEEKIQNGENGDDLSDEEMSD